MNSGHRANLKRGEPRMNAKKFCVWEYNDIYDFYETPCNDSGYAFTVGTVKENKFKFCPYCGRKIKVKNER